MQKQTISAEEFLKESWFIHNRTKWLASQPQNAEGMLLRADDRAEARIIYARIEEFEKMYANGDIHESTGEDGAYSCA